MRTITSLLASTVAATCIAGCEQSSDSLVPHDTYSNYWTSPAAASHNPAPSHVQELTGSGQNGITDLVTAAAMSAAMGTPDQVARMHGTQKIQYAMLGSFLKDLGVTIPAATTSGSGGGKGSGGGTTAAPSAGSLYANGSSALGAPIYPNRTPEMIVPSTAALAKEFDIFMAAAPAIIAGIANSTRCPGVALVTSGELTADGISCLIGKPSTPDHLTLANQIVSSASDPTTGQEIAVATLLAAAHISE
jgi:hypothetical protein